MTDKKKRFQMAFDVSKEIHTQVKVLAALRNISINNWMARAINDRIAKETKYDEKTKELYDSNG
jgi:predicted HicB family RNase H-like nuclease